MKSGQIFFLVEFEWFIHYILDVGIFGGIHRERVVHYQERVIFVERVANIIFSLVFVRNYFRIWLMLYFKYMILLKNYFNFLNNIMLY